MAVSERSATDLYYADPEKEIKKLRKSIRKKEKEIN